MIASLLVLLMVGMVAGGARIEYTSRTRDRAWEERLDIGSSLHLKNDDISFVDVVSSCSSMNMYHCPLAGFVLVGSRGGHLLLLSRGGDVALEATGPVGAGEVKVVRTVQTKGHRIPHDVLLVASFGGISGLYGLLVNHRTMDVDPRGWLKLTDRVKDIVDVRVVTCLISPDRIKLVLPSVVVLDSRGDAYVGLDVSLNATVSRESTGDRAFQWPLQHVKQNVSHIFASYKFGMYLVGWENGGHGDGDSGYFVHRVDRPTMKAFPVSTRCHVSGPGHFAFDDVFHEIFVSWVDDNTLRRYKLAPGSWTEIHSIPLLERLGRPTHLTSSGGYSLVSGKDLMVLYNHSIELVREYFAPWDTRRFISFIASEEDLMGQKMRGVLDGLFHWWETWKQADGGFEGHLALWGPLTFLYRNKMVIISSSRRSVQLYQPKFQAVVGRTGTPRSKDVMNLLLGILKSVGLIGAGIIGLMLSKRKPYQTAPRGMFGQSNSTTLTERRPRREGSHLDHVLEDALDAGLADIYTEYRLERDKMGPNRRRKVPDMTKSDQGRTTTPGSEPHGLLQDRVDFAPDPELWMG